MKRSAHVDRIFTGLALALAACASACTRRNSPEPALDGGAHKAAQDETSSPPSALTVHLSEPMPPADAAACGAWRCLSFVDPLSAFQHVLAHHPLVLGIGEAHAQAGHDGVASSTKRFTESFLPHLAGRASGLVLELWLGEPKCGEDLQLVREAQKPVTQSQAKTNPNELVALGDRAYALGIPPFPLRPSCADYGPIARAARGDAGSAHQDDADPIDLMLKLIERLSEARMKRLLQEGSRETRALDAGGPDLIVAYGGALHNDVAPPPGNEAYSFGPAMIAATSGRYIELDLIVGDFVQSGGPWTKLAWVPTYLASSPGDQAKTLLYRTGDASFVLVFPKATPTPTRAQ